MRLSLHKKQANQLPVQCIQLPENLQKKQIKQESITTFSNILASLQ